MCNCDDNLDLDDDSMDGEAVCEECAAEFNESVAAYEPVDDPQPQPLLPGDGELPIEIGLPTASNVNRLVRAFSVTYHHLRAQAVLEAPMTEADAISALTQIWRGFAFSTVVQRVEQNPTAAALNKALIIHKLDTLISEMLNIETPEVIVN